MNLDEDDEVRTNLAMRIGLRRRIEVQARIDKRQRKAEIITLLEEALDRREKRGIK